ncbi:hypothetical protein DIPPA_64053 [Diplonema papillatum]|nr:hypothetical protein DIPPA_64053 [Diplonema papillatum]
MGENENRMAAERTLIKAHHATLRKRLRSGQPVSEVWRDNCEDAPALASYASAMKALGTEWERKDATPAGGSLPERLEWILQAIHSYYRKTPPDRRAKRPRGAASASATGLVRRLLKEEKRVYFSTNGVVMPEPIEALTVERLSAANDLPVAQHLRVIDVGSCYNPLQAPSLTIPGLNLDILPIDLHPETHSPEVLICDFSSVAFHPKPPDIPTTPAKSGQRARDPINAAMHTNGNTNETPIAQQCAGIACSIGEPAGSEEARQEAAPRGDIMPTVAGTPGAYGMPVLKGVESVSDKATLPLFSEGEPLDLMRSRELVVVQDRAVKSFEAGGFHAVVFCLLLSYMPCARMRYRCIVNAYRALCPLGLLVLVTPRTVGKSNLRWLKAWTASIEASGFSRCGQEIKQKIVCLSFCKTATSAEPAEVSDALAQIRIGADDNRAESEDEAP